MLAIEVNRHRFIQSAGAADPCRNQLVTAAEDGHVLPLNALRHARAFTALILTPILDPMMVGVAAAHRNDLPIMPIATNAEIAANPFCSCGPASRDAMSRPPIIPASAPPQNGTAIAQLR